MVFALGHCPGPSSSRGVGGPPPNQSSLNLGFHLTGLSSGSCSPCCGSEVYLPTVTPGTCWWCSKMLGHDKRWWPRSCHWHPQVPGETNGAGCCEDAEAASLLPATLPCQGRNGRSRQSLHPLDMPPGYGTGDKDTTSAWGSCVLFSGRMQTARRWRGKQAGKKGNGQDLACCRARPVPACSMPQ